MSCWSGSLRPNTKCHVGAPWSSATSSTNASPSQRPVARPCSRTSRDSRNQASVTVSFQLPTSASSASTAEFRKGGLLLSSRCVGFSFCWQVTAQPRANDISWGQRLRPPGQAAGVHLRQPAVLPMVAPDPLSSALEGDLRIVLDGARRVDRGPGHGAGGDRVPEPERDRRPAHAVDRGHAVGQVEAGEVLVDTVVARVVDRPSPVSVQAGPEVNVRVDQPGHQVTAPALDLPGPKPGDTAGGFDPLDPVAAHVNVVGPPARGAARERQTDVPDDGQLGVAHAVPFSSSGKWQAAAWPAVPCSWSAGTSTAQISCARGQRVRKRQPEGGRIADGASPAIRKRAVAGPAGPSTSGTESIRPRV